MIARYTRPEMAELLSDDARFRVWAKVEILASAAHALLGEVPNEAVEDMRRASVPSADQVAELEKERDHEVLSFLAAFCQGLPERSARWVHLGMTSYDLVDTAQGHILALATDMVIAAALRLRQVLTERAVEHWNTLCVGRTHGVHAEPTTFGHKLAGFAFAVDRSLRRLRAARQAVAVGTISGAVGTYSLIDPFVEQYVCTELGLTVEHAPTQVVARDRHAELVAALAVLGSSVGQIALELRLLQRTEVAEVEEHRAGAYQGSSAMPHKRNPTTSERLCGLARLLRGYVTPMLEGVALWHERDLAHSSVERVAMVDALCVAHYQAEAAAGLVDTLTVHAERMRVNLDTTGGLIFSSGVLTQLLHDGVEREQAYRQVQAAANRAVAGPDSFAASLRAEGIDVDLLEAERFLSRHHVILDRLEKFR